jgi:hypothetical protein
VTRSVADIRATGAAWVTEAELAWLCDEVERLREALRPFAEDWDFHAADYLAELVDGKECRIIDAATVSDIIAAVEVARAALAGEKP